MITVPLKNASSFKKIKDTQISDNKHAIKKLIKTLELRYKKAPYFDVIMPMIANLLVSSTNIAQMNYKSILAIKDYLGIDTEIVLSSHFNKNDDLKGQDKVIHINHILGAKIYLNAIGGVSLYDKQYFKQCGLELHFVKTNEDLTYKQFNNNFVPNLSIIDVLMFNSPKEIKNLLNAYTLI